jgi:hypothetical protein
VGNLDLVEAEPANDREGELGQRIPPACLRLAVLRLSQQGFELGEDLLNGIEVGRVFRQEHEARPDVADRTSPHLSLVGAEIVEDNVIRKISA